MEANMRQQFLDYYKGKGKDGGKPNPIPSSLPTPAELAKGSVIKRKIKTPTQIVREGGTVAEKSGKAVIKRRKVKSTKDDSEAEDHESET